MKIKIKKGDQVKVLAGKDTGRTGVVEKVLPKLGQIVVGGINVYKKHQKAAFGKPSGIVEVSKPLSVSKVAFVCPSCAKSTRLRFKITADKKVRSCIKCGAEV